MKRFFSLLLLSTILFALCGNMQAQNNEKQRPDREQLAQNQAQRIATTLGLDATKSQQFIQTYCQFQQELWAIGPRMPKQNKGNQTQMSEAQTEDAIKTRFERSQKILNLREKYYTEYSKFLTQNQIERVYQMENQFMQRMAKRNQEGKQRKR